MPAIVGVLSAALIINTRFYAKVSLVVSVVLTVFSVALLFSFDRINPDMLTNNYVWLSYWNVGFSQTMTKAKLFYAVLAGIVFTSVKVLFFYERKIERYKVISISVYETLLLNAFFTNSLLFYCFLIGSMLIPGVFMLDEAESKRLEAKGAAYFAQQFISVLLLAVSFFFISGFGGHSSFISDNMFQFRHVACFLLALGIVIQTPLLPFGAVFYNIERFRSVSNLLPMLFAPVLMVYGLSTFLLPSYYLELQNMRYLFFAWGTVALLISLSSLITEERLAKKLYSYLQVVCSLILLGISSVQVLGFVGAAILSFFSLIVTYALSVLIIFAQGRRDSFSWSVFNENPAWGVALALVAAFMTLMPVSFGFIGLVLLVKGLMLSFGPFVLLVLPLIILLLLIGTYRSFNHSVLSKVGTTSIVSDRSMVFSVHLLPLCLLLVVFLIFPGIIVSDFKSELEMVLQQYVSR